MSKTVGVVHLHVLARLHVGACHDVLRDSRNSADAPRPYGKPAVRALLSNCLSYYQPDYKFCVPTFAPTAILHEHPWQSHNSLLAIS